jgi:hypothetical protein
MITPTKAGRGSCMRMRPAITRQQAMNMTGATGNHQPLTGSGVLNNVEAVSARNRTAEKIM